MDPHANTASAGELFTEAELEKLHGEDLVAGTRVVSLLVGIFSVGVVLYTIVAWSCT